MARYQVIREYSFEFESDEPYDPESEEGALPLAERYLEANPQPEIVAEIMGVFPIDDEQLYDAKDFLAENDRCWLPFQHFACDHEGCTIAGFHKLMTRIGAKYFCPEHAKKVRTYRSKSGGKATRSSNRA